MAFSAKLKIGDKDNIDVIKCDYALHRELDAKGGTVSHLYGGTIELTIESTDDNHIIESMVNQYKLFDGTVTIKKDDEDATMKEVSWEQGKIVRFHEGFDNNSNRPMLIDFTISAGKLKVGNAVHDNNWAKGK